MMTPESIPQSTASPSATPVCDAMRAKDAWNPAWDDFAALDPAWTEKFMTMGVAAMQNGALDPLTIEFIAIAVDASCTHLYAPGVRRHIRKALELGATPQQVLTVLQLVSVLGIHSLSLGAPILKEEMVALAANSSGDSPIGKTK